MPVTVGINHVTTTTTDVDRMVRFYSEMFDAEKVFEGPAVDGYPRMAIVGLGAERYVKVVEDAADQAGPAAPVPDRGVVTERFGLAVDSLATLRELRDRMLGAGRGARRDRAAAHPVGAGVHRSGRHAVAGLRACPAR